MRRRRQQRALIDLETDGRTFVCLRVAAEYLGLDERTVKERIEDGKLRATIDGRVYQITLSAIADYERLRQRLAS